jgi:hypothetical protein
MIGSSTEGDLESLKAAGLPSDEASSWVNARPGRASADFSADRQKFSDYWARAARLLALLPRKRYRNALEQVVARSPVASTVAGRSTPWVKARLKQSKA